MILWVILKALGCVLLFILFLMAVILFAPIRYKFHADYQDKLGVYVKASWIWRAITVIYDTGVSPALTLKIFGRRGRQPEKNKMDSDEKTHSNRKKNKTEGKKAGKQKDKGKGSSPKGGKQGDKSKEGSSKGGNLEEYWRRFREYPRKEALLKKTVLFMKRLLRALLPSKAEGECHFGFDDPSATGLVLGASHALLGAANLYDHIRVSADFENKAFNLKCRIAGKITLWSMFWPLAAYVLSKPVWIIIKPLIFKRKRKDEPC